MKTQKLPILTLAAITLATTLAACGKTNYAPATGTTAAAAVSSVSTITSIATTTFTSTSTSVSTSGNPPISFSFDLLGTQTAVTPPITTDNVLIVEFQVGRDQGNSIWQADQLAVTLSINGANVQPTYNDSGCPSGGCVYGLINEVSGAINLSNYLSPGGTAQITIGSPMNDFYCTYVPNPFYSYDPSTGLEVPINPQYNQWPGCYKATNAVHHWSGTLLVQTSSTTAI